MIARHDFLTALYRLSKARGYAVTAVLTLGLTLGTLIATFNLNYQVLAAPLPYADEDRIVVGTTAWLAKDGRVLYPNLLPVHVFRQLYPHTSAYLADQALFSFSYVGMTLRDLPDSPQIQVAYATPGYMRMFQMPLILGQAFQAEEEMGSHSPVAILSEKLWRTHYKADPAMVGRSIQIGHQLFRVVGIAAATFQEPALTGPARQNDVWLPWDYATGSQAAPGEISGAHLYLAKLKNAADRQAFEQELKPLVQQRYQEEVAAIPEMAGRSAVFHADPLRKMLEGDSIKATASLLGGSLLLLLIAAANISNLLLARAAGQQRTMSIQAALGAQRHHLVGTVLAELSWLLTTALLLALLVAQGIYALLRTFAGTTLPHMQHLGFNWLTLGFAVSICLLLALAFAALVSRHIHYRALQQQLQQSGKGSHIQTSSRIRQLLICSQVMLATILLTGSTQILLQSLQQLRQQTGFASTDRYQVTIDNIAPASEANVSPEQRRAIYRQQKQELMQVRDILQQHPAVQSVSVSNYPPVSFDGFFGSANFLTSPDRHSQPLFSRAVYTDQFYLPLFDIRLVQGRNFTAEEINTQALVIIVNQTFARQIQPDGNVVGRILYSTDGQLAFEIIGISADLNLPDLWSPNETGRSYLTRNLGSTANLLLQLKPGLSIDKTAINQAMMQISPGYRAASIYSVENNIKQIQMRNVLTAAVTSSIVLVSFLLAAIGIYGVLSYNVQLRRFELGVRMAIGARPSTILYELLGEILTPVAAGLAAAACILTIIWTGLQHSAFTLEVSASGLLATLGMIVVLTVMTSSMSVWSIIRRPAGHALKGN